MLKLLSLTKFPGKLLRTTAFALGFVASISAAGEISPLLQTDFPYTKACIGAPWPDKNIAYKGIAIRLGHDRYVTFDTDLLRYSAGWQGGYITAHGVAFDGSHGGFPTVAGDLQWATKVTPGWSNADGAFKDPRNEPFGPLPRDWAAWHGLYVSGDHVILSYSVLGTKIIETPSAMERDGSVAFIRSFDIGDIKKELTLAVCDGTAEVSITDGIAKIPGPKGTLFVALSGAPKEARLLSGENNRLLLKLPKGSGKSTFNLVLLPADNAEKLGAFTSVKPQMPEFKKGGPARWPDPVVTQGVLGNSDGPFAIDQLTPPTENPWKRRVRFGGLDFFKDGKRAALSTWDGDVWIVSGIDDSLEKLTWRRFASGGYETLGLKIVDDVIYTSGRDEITRYHDLNNDGEADFYENFNNEVTSSTGFHEFVFDLHTDPQGNFLFAKAGPVRSGGSGFGGGGGNGDISAHAGTVLRVSRDGKKLDVYATGFRAPNGIGVSPKGQVTTGDNEGTWVPACPLNWVNEGGFYGVEDLAHRTPLPNYSKPLCWMSHNEFDNSGGAQVWITGGKWPLQGELIHLSYGQCAAYLVLKDKVGEQMQGGVVRIPVNFSSSAMRGRFNPKDGQLYVAGLQGWQTKAPRITGLDRVRYTGKPLNSVVKMKVNKKGIHLTFSDELDKTEAEDVQNYSGKQWNYRRTREYGSAEYSVKDPQKRGRDNVDITKATLSPDGKTVLLEIADFKPVMQMQINYALKTKAGSEIDQKILQTIHEIPE
ncbi:MAG: DUF6797 domain-containing protein [Verrucomicrobiota bacterium]|nr:DUF6797 domain-containing protein [Verrucomicrobiota bacterium]